VIVQDKWEGVGKIGIFRQVSHYIMKTVHDTAIVTIEDE